jgi:hypothetical protein
MDDMNRFDMDECRLLEIGMLSSLTDEQRAALGPLEPEDIAARWFDGAELAAYYFLDGSVVIAPLNYELRPGDLADCEGWATTTIGPDSSIDLAGGMRRWDGKPPPGADDPNYDAEPEWWLSD